MEKIGCFLILSMIILVAAKPLLEDHFADTGSDNVEVTTLAEATTHIPQDVNGTEKEL